MPNWTPDQQKVIDTRDRDILVSAAAGSGKTSVLVARILARITDPGDPMDIDELLVVTYTEAAAAEMRERIFEALEEQLSRNPEDRHLARQAALVHGAQISTIHGFCLNVIRSHFQLIDLDPTFRVGDESEVKMLRSDVMDELLEEAYTEMTPEFQNLVESLETGRQDSRISETVFKLYDAAISYADPEEYLELCLRAGNADEIVSYVVDSLRNCVMDLSGVPEKYLPTIEADNEMFRNIKAQTYEELAEAISHVSMPKLPQIRGEVPGKAQTQRRRKIISEKVNALQENYFYAPCDQIRADLEISSRIMKELVSLTRRFIDAYALKKREKNLIDFSDMEHLALQILDHDEAAGAYRKSYREIMVDEYQDSSAIQEALLSRISSPGKRFMVGDVKQSIYSFRLARPELFLEKYHAYENAEKACRIDLHSNFRSRNQILESVNRIFSRIMRKEIGAIEYDEAQSLVYGATCYETEDPVTDVILVDTTKEKMADVDDSAMEIEARAIGEKIRTLVKTEKLTDRSNNGLRPMSYGDIVILTRKAVKWADVLVRTLSGMGIPVRAESRSGYFDAPEVRTILNYLNLLDNPLQDLPLAAVMRSPIGGFRSGELADLKLAFPGKTLSQAMQLSEDPKVTAFREELQLHREMIHSVPIHMLIRRILEDTGYDVYIAALPDGERRQANVEMLVQRAADYGQTGYKGLFRFLRYIGQLKDQEVDFGEANITEDTDSVRVMTIHKSKGLEFPCVFVAGLGGKLSRTDTDAVTVNARLGAACDAVDPKLRVKSATVAKRYLQYVQAMDSLGEELRVLYVAMTRAKEKLILTGNIGKIEESLTKWRETTWDFGRMSTASLVEAGTYLDLVMPVILDSDDLFDVTVTDPEQLEDREMADALMDRADRASVVLPVAGQIYEPYLEAELEAAAAYQYPYEEATVGSAKKSVSDIRLELLNEETEAQYGPEIPVPLIPAFLSGEAKRTGAAVGTAYHKFLECYDYETPVEEAVLQLPEDMRELVNPGAIRTFLDSSLGREMSRAHREGCLFREQIFMIGTEEHLIQGIIDAYFETPEGYVIVDYKTERVGTAEELLKRFGPQLTLYRDALIQLTGRPVCRTVIYSFALKKEIVVS